MQLVLVSMLFLVVVTIVIMYQAVPRAFEAFACGGKRKKKKCMSASASCDTKYIPWPIFFGIPQKEEVIVTVTQPPVLIMPTARPQEIEDVPEDTLPVDDDTADMEMEPDPVDLPMIKFPPVEMQTQAPKVTLQPPLDSRKGVLDPEMRLSGTILASVRKEMLPLINRERTCANLKGLVIDDNLNDAAQRLAVEVIEYDLRTDYPHLSLFDQVTVDDRVKATQWKGAAGTGNIDQIIQFSKLLYDTNTPPMVVRDIMCDGSSKKKMMNESFTSVGIGYGRGNSSDTRTNTKSVYIMLFGKDPAITAPPIMPPKDGNCTDWSIKSTCS
jgi:uncharacterized protein YkwD